MANIIAIGLLVGPGPQKGGKVPQFPPPPQILLVALVSGMLILLLYWGTNFWSSVSQFKNATTVFLLYIYQSSCHCVDNTYWSVRSCQSLISGCFLPIYSLDGLLSGITLCSNFIY